MMKRQRSSAQLSSVRPALTVDGCHDRDVGVFEPLARKLTRALVDLDGVGNRAEQVVTG